MPRTCGYTPESTSSKRRWRGARSSHALANAPLAEDPARLGRVVNQLAAQLLHDGAQPTDIAGMPPAPNLAEQPVGSRHPSGVERKDTNSKVLNLPSFVDTYDHAITDIGKRAGALSTTSCGTVWASRLALIRKMAPPGPAMRPLNASRSCFSGPSPLRCPSPGIGPDLCGIERRSPQRRVGSGRWLRIVTIVPARRASHVGHNNHRLRHLTDTILCMRLGYVFVPLGYDCCVIQGAIEVRICVLMGGRFSRRAQGFDSYAGSRRSIGSPKPGDRGLLFVGERTQRCNTNCDGDGP